METMTYQERETLRRLWFHRFNTWHLDHVADMEAHRVAMAETYSADALIDLRSTNVPALPVERRQSALRACLTSPRRFLAWLNTYRQTERVAVDYMAAVADAGLVDVDRTRVPGIYSVTPRDTTPTWETRRDERPAPVPAVKPYSGRQVVPYGRLTEHEYSRGIADYVPVSMVPVAVVDASAVDPGRYFPGATTLARAARDFLAEHGEHMPLPDVYDVRKHRWHSRPDRVAFRGIARVKRNAPMRYERKITPRTHVGADGQIELATVLARRYYCSCGTAGTFQADRKRCVCEPIGWRGHRAERFPRGKTATRNVKRAETRKARPTATSTRGKSVGPWSMSERSLAVAAKPVADQVALTESVLRMASETQAFTLSDGTTVTVLSGTQVHWSDRAWPIREWSRRAALAGLTTVR